MRPTVAQAIIGLLLSTTLAGALALPGQVVIADDPPPKGLALPAPRETQEVVRAAPVPRPPAPGPVSATRTAPVPIVKAADAGVAGAQHGQDRQEPALAPPPAETEEPTPAPPPSAQAPPPPPVAPPPPPPDEPAEPTSPPPADTTFAQTVKKAKKAKKPKKA